MKGTEIRVDLYDVDRDILMDVDQMEQVCKAAIKKHGATFLTSAKVVLGATSPPGFTLAILLDESSVTVHTYANEGLMAVNVFTCGKKANPKMIARDIMIYARGCVVFSDDAPRFATPNPDAW